MSFCALDKDCCVYDSVSESAGLSYGNPICHGCEMAAGATLNQLRYDYIDLSQLIPKADAHSESKIHRPKPESAPPVNMAVYQLRSQIAYYVGVVAAVVRRECGDSPRNPMPVREGFGLDHDVRYLRERVMAIAGLPVTAHYWNAELPDLSTMDGPQVVDRFGALHRSSRRMCGLDPRTITVPGDCPACETPSLRRPDDDPDKIWCLHCKRRMTAAQYGQSLRLTLPRP